MFSLRVRRLGWGLPTPGLRDETSGKPPAAQRRGEKAAGTTSMFSCLSIIPG